MRAKGHSLPLSKILRALKFREGGSRLSPVGVIVIVSNYAYYRDIYLGSQLTEENFRAIAGLMLSEVKDVLAEKNMELAWDESVIDYLVSKGYSVTYGARNLRRLIQKEIEDEIAAALIEKRGAGVSTVSLSAADGKVEVSCQ